METMSFQQTTPKPPVSGKVIIDWYTSNDPHANDSPSFNWSMTFDPPLSSDVLIALLEQIVAAERDESD